MRFPTSLDLKVTDPESLANFAAGAYPESRGRGPFGGAPRTREIGAGLRTRGTLLQTQPLTPALYLKVSPLQAPPEAFVSLSTHCFVWVQTIWSLLVCILSFQFVGFFVNFLRID